MKYDRKGEGRMERIMDREKEELRVEYIVRRKNGE